jgi:hypothetical protein
MQALEVVTNNEAFAGLNLFSISYTFAFSIFSSSPSFQFQSNPF